MILLIDNYDSFTYNLYQQIADLGEDVLVKANDEITIHNIRSLSPTKIVISPGPKRPEDSGISLEVIRQFHKEIPILGVCLGHQCIAQVFGARIIHAPEVMHGKTSRIHHTGSGLFHDVEQDFPAARYHSLIVQDCPDNFAVTAWTDADEHTIIMGIEHTTYPLFGIQFHPESFMTEQGQQIMRNFLACQ